MFRPLRAAPVADRLPALRRRLQAHPARLPHWAGNREEASTVGSPREQSQDDPVTSRKVSASPGRKSDMRFSLTAPSPESTRTRVRAHAYTHADRPRDAGTRGGKGASPPACATAVRAQTPGVRTGPRPKRATWSGGGEGVGGVRGPKTARGIIGFSMPDDRASLLLRSGGEPEGSRAVAGETVDRGGLRACRAERNKTVGIASHGDEAWAPREERSPARIPPERQRARRGPCGCAGRGARWPVSGRDDGSHPRLARGGVG